MTFGDQVGSLRRTLHRALVKRIAALSDLPLTQLLALRTVARNEVETQAQLAERLLIDAPAASRLVARLEADGLLVRKAGSDRRCVKLAITPAAKNEVAAMEEGLAWLEREIKSHLSPSEVKAT